MANVTITQLPQAGPILGTESVPIVQNGQTVQTTTAAIAGSPTQTYQYLTVVQTPNLPNSRYLAAGSGLLLTDGGAQSTYTISLGATLSSFNTALAGFMVKTDSSTVTNRFMQASGVGITVSNGDGVSGNPVYSLTGNVLSLANCSGNGMLTFIDGIGVQPVTIQGTASEIDVANGTGVSGNPTIGLADNPTIPGTSGMIIPKGTSAQEPAGAEGQFRFNTDTQTFDGYAAGSWRQFSLTGGVTSFSAGTTGFTPVSATSGAVTLAGTLATTNGGTGQTTFTDGQLLIGNSVGNTLAKATLTAGTGITVTNGNGSITIDALNNGTVTSVDASGGTTGLSFSGGPITTSGTLTIAGTLITSNGGTGLTSYTAGDLPYYASGTALSKLGIGLSTYLLTSSGTAPQWSDPATVTVGTATSATTATNVAGGTANQIVYNTAAGTTSFITAPSTADRFLKWTGSAFTWDVAGAGTVTSVDVSGGTTGLTTSGGPITSSGTITLAGTLAVANGGTGQTSYTDGELLIGNTTGNTLSKSTLTAGSGITITNGSGSITIAATGGGTVTSVDVSGGTTGLTFSGGPVTSSGTITMAGTLAIANGGTGQTTAGAAFDALAPTTTEGDVIFRNSTTNTRLAIGSSTYIMTSTGTAPQWSDPAGITVGTATNATNVATTATSVNATFYPTFVDASTGNNGIEVDTDLTYNPSTNTLTVPNLVATSGISGGTF